MGEENAQEVNQSQSDNSTDTNTREENKTPTFDELLTTNKEYQAEFDKKIAKALSTAKSKWENMTNEKLSEAEKLSKMTKDEKTQYQLSKKEKELLDRENELNKKELMSTAKVQLSEAGISSELAQLLDYSDAESCKKSIESLTKAFNSAVEKAVESKLKGGTVMGKANSNQESETEKLLKIMRNA